LGGAAVVPRETMRKAEWPHYTRAADATYSADAGDEAAHVSPITAGPRRGGFRGGWRGMRGPGGRAVAGESDHRVSRLRLRGTAMRRAAAAAGPIPSERGMPTT